MQLVPSLVQERLRAKMVQVPKISAVAVVASGRRRGRKSNSMLVVVCLLMMVIRLVVGVGWMVVGRCLEGIKRSVTLD